MIKIDLSDEQTVMLMRLLGAGKGALEYSLENDDVRGVMRRMCEQMISEYAAMQVLIASQYNSQVK